MFRRSVWFLSLFLVSVITLGSPCFGKALTVKDFVQEPLVFSYGKNEDLSLTLENKLKIEGFYSKNMRELNDMNNAGPTAFPFAETGGFDKVVFTKFTDDFKLTHKFKNPDCDWTRITCTAGIRLKGSFGDPEAGFKTGPTPIKDLDVVMGLHRHAFNVHVPVVREIWMELLLNDLMGMGWSQKHTFTLGLFPFALGRGISLGDAYAIAPDVVGYDPESSVEQYAPGFKLSGSFLDDKMCDYDFYVALLQNRSGSFDTVNEKILGRLYGHRYNQGRGFGAINFIVAGRLKNVLVDEPCRKISIEPYALFDNERFQRVEVPSDASTKMGTIGCAGECALGDFEFGFDGALNVGKQNVYGLDRNTIIKEIRGSYISVVNSKVIAVEDNPNTGDIAGQKALYCTDEVNHANNQRLVSRYIEEASPNSCLANRWNGQIIPQEEVTDSKLRNAADRFRDPYVNIYNGAMFVFDWSYYFANPNLKLAGTFGYATGDDAPNLDLDAVGDSDVDGTYSGFVSLQELYSGRRVRSAVLLSGKGSFPRLLSFPINSRVAGGIPTSTSRFNNLVFTGGALWLEREYGCTLWRINPNVLAFWQEHAARIAVVDNRDVLASKFLGTEANIYVDCFTTKGLNCFLVTGFFLPGSHYEAVAGKPLSAAERRYLDRLDRTGVSEEWVPTLGHDPAYFINAGFEYKF